MDNANATPTMIRIWRRNDDDEPPKDSASFSVHDSPGLPIYAIALTRDGTRIAVAAHSGVSLWKLDGDKPERLWHNPGACHTVAFAPDDQQLVASFDSGVEDVPGNVSLFNLAGESQASWNFPAAPTDLTFASDGRHLLTANTNGTVYVLRLPKLMEHKDATPAVR